MNIMFYIPELDQGWGGVRQYAAGLLKLLAQSLEHTYYIYHNSSDPEILALLAENKHFRQIQDADVALTALQKKSARSKQIVNAISRRIAKGPQFNIPSIVDRLIDLYLIDIIHCPYQFAPVTTKAKLIVTLHDVQEIHFPEFFTAEERAWRATHFLDYMRRATRIVVSYAHVKQDLANYFAVPEAVLSVILLDMSKLWFERFTPEQVLPLTELKLPETFVLYPANTWKHKNHLNLLRAVALLRDEYDCIINVVCSGHTNKHYDSVILNEIQQLQLENQVRFLGVVDEQTLFSLYRHCTGVVVPTLYEAGSFPLMESILLEVPVICSNVTSLPETVGDDNFTFEPKNVESIAHKLRQLWYSDDFRKQSVRNTKKMQGRLRHTNALREFSHLYEEIQSS